MAGNARKDKAENRLGRFFKSLQERYHRVIEVIDEALASDSLRDRIWAVEQILKRIKPGEEKKRNARPKAGNVDVSKLSDEELLVKIRELLGDDDSDQNYADYD